MVEIPWRLNPKNSCVRKAFTSRLGLCWKRTNFLEKQHTLRYKTLLCKHVLLPFLKLMTLWNLRITVGLNNNIILFIHSNSFVSVIRNVGRILTLWGPTYSRGTGGRHPLRGFLVFRGHVSVMFFIPNPQKFPACGRTPPFPCFLQGSLRNHKFP